MTCPETVKLKGFFFPQNIILFMTFCDILHDAKCLMFISISWRFISVLTVVSFQVDTFTVEAVDLGELEKIVIAKGPGSPWLLDKVVVKENEYSALQYNFVHGK